MGLYAFARALLFRLSPERAHALALTGLRLAAGLPPTRALLRARFSAVSKQPVELFGLTFCNPVGLAAGYDKDGLAWRGLGLLGFGHVEIGTVTPRPQPGNPRPRLFRLPEARGLINRMGFPGRGAAFVARRLRGPRPPGLVLGVNIGKNKDTPLEEAASDYAQLVETFSSLADYLTINVSSPNTVGLRRLQARGHLESILKAVRDRPSSASAGRRLPILVKLAPDLTDDELDDALGAVMDGGADGVIATNTTIARPGVEGPTAGEAGGLSGAPLQPRSTEVVRAIHRRTEGRLPIVAAGGIMDPDDARAKIDAGATLVQLYTGLVYRGPSLVREIVHGL